MEYFRGSVGMGVELVNSESMVRISLAIKLFQKRQTLSMHFRMKERQKNFVKKKRKEIYIFQLDYPGKAVNLYFWLKFFKKDKNC